MIGWLVAAAIGGIAAVLQYGRMLAPSGAMRSALGALRAIAVTSAKPDPKLPGVEPIAVQGVPGFEAYTWWGVVAPGNMPGPLVKRLYEELAKAVSTPAVREKLVAQGMEVRGAAGDELDAFVRKEMVRWAKVIKDNKIKSGD